MKNYTYPRVVTSVIANKRTSIGPAPEDTTVLFVPIISETGPEKELTKIHSLPEFLSKFGADKRMGRTLLNIANWLTAGGTLYTYRLVDDEGAKKASAEVVSSSDVYSKITGKYVGGLLNNAIVTLNLSGTVLTVSLALFGEGVRERFSVSLKGHDNASTIQPYANTVTYKEYKVDVSSYSEYLSEIIVTVATDTSGKTLLATVGDSGPTGNSSIKCTLTGGADGLTNAKYAYNNALRTFWSINSDTQEFSKDVISALGNKLESPVDLIMDAGYPKDIKKAMIKVICSVDSAGQVNALRDDIRGYFDLGYEGDTGNEAGNIKEIDFSEIDSELFDDEKPYKETSNVFFYAQNMIISEETYFDKDYTVYPSYYLSALIPMNDINNGIQFPLAGKRRAELEGIKKLSVNPDPDKKEEWFTARVNYIEKDSRGYYFMSQRTYDGSSAEEYTPLSFINNSRVTCKMVHDIERLGREYLFEFNDATTLSNMRAVLNRYVTNWIANRTLDRGEVIVEPDQYSGEKVNVTLRMRFTGTIEVISVDIILD